MKKLFCLLLITIPFMSFSQSALLDRFKQKVKNRVDQRVDEGMDRSIDEAEKEINKSAKSKNKSEEGAAAEEKNTAAKGNNTAAEKTQTPSFKSYSRYDFVPGENIVYAEDFSQDVIGEFPLKWVTNSRGETVTIQGIDSKWLRMYQNSIFLSPYIKTLPENFTAEFDLILNYSANELSYVYPEIEITLLNAAPEDEKGKDFFYSEASLSDVKMIISPGNEGSSSIRLRCSKEGKETFTNSSKSLNSLGYNFGKPVHFAIWVQKERLRLWVQGNKVYDMPQAVPEKAAFNRLALKVASSNYEEETVGYYITNIKFAQGTPDMRSKLITEGKLVTSGILFDVNSDKIKPESYGVLQEIAKVLKENADVKVKIIGHTDNDGEDAKNLDLSKRRAASVKQALSAEFGIDAARMQTDGKGETQPVADNTTKEGKAKNRRVEFVKL